MVKILAAQRCIQIEKNILIINLPSLRKNNSQKWL